VVVRAVPPLPSSFYGTIKLNGANVPDGTQVQALINGKIVAYSQTQTYQGDSVYSLDIPGDDSSSAAVEGGAEGDVISFNLGGITANQTGAWHSATNVNLNLTAASANTPQPPQATQPPPPTQTEIPILPTAVIPTINSTFPTAPLAPTAAPGGPAQASATQAAQPEVIGSPDQPVAGQNTAVVTPPAGSSAPTAASAAGVPQSNSTVSPTVGSPTESPKTGASVWIFGLLILVVFGLSGFWYFRRKKG
jgi:LPXTG-motif cell wall-anchored protein